MSDDDLVKRLREAADDEHYWAEQQDFWHEEILREAADRIEALEQRLDATKDKAEAAILDLMSKLAKAAAEIEALEWFSEVKAADALDARQRLTTLAEIEG